MDASSISLSGLKANVAQLNASASNIVNMQTPGYQPVGVAQTTTVGGGVSTRWVQIASTDLSSDLVTQTMALANYRANLAAINAQSQMANVTLDLLS